VGTLRPNRVVITNSATNQLSSSVVNNTELSYLSGVTSAVQTQLNGKVAKAGDTMTGTLQLPAGTTALPALTFTSSTTSGLSASAITANLSGNATTATTATNFSGSLVGDVTGTQGATVVSFVGGQTAANVAAATVLANAATSANTASAIVRRDGSGNFVAGTITASLTGADSINV